MKEAPSPDPEKIRLVLSEYPRLYDRYCRELEALPEMTVEPHPLADGEAWRAEGVVGQAIQEITSPRGFFNIVGIEVTKTPKGKFKGFSWTQPLMDQAIDSIEVETPQGTRELNGFVSIVTDTKGRVLLTLGQEPAARTKPKFALYRTPFQATATKFKEIREGKTALDQAQAMVLRSMGEELDIFNLFRTGKIPLLELPLADANRIDTVNGSWNLQVSEPKVIEELSAIGNFYTLNEVQALMRTGLVNGLTVNAIALHLGFGSTRKQS